MNAPFQPEIIQSVLAKACVSISDLKRNPAAVVAEARLRQVAILNRNKPVAYMISPQVWEYLCDLADDARDADEASALLESIERGEEETIPATIDELLR